MSEKCVLISWIAEQLLCKEIFNSNSVNCLAIWTTTLCNFCKYILFRVLILEEEKNIKKEMQRFYSPAWQKKLSCEVNIYTGVKRPSYQHHHYHNHFIIIIIMIIIRIINRKSGGLCTTDSCLSASAPNGGNIAFHSHHHHQPRLNEIKTGGDKKKKCRLRRMSHPKL